MCETCRGQVARGNMQGQLKRAGLFITLNKAEYSIHSILAFFWHFPSLPTLDLAACCTLCTPESQRIFPYRRSTFDVGSWEKYAGGLDCQELVMAFLSATCVTSRLVSFKPTGPKLSFTSSDEECDEDEGEEGGEGDSSSDTSEERRPRPLPRSQPPHVGRPSTL
jgi:hypothetical protein